MSLHRAPLLLWGAVLGSFVLGTFCDPPPHSLSYSYLQLSEPTQGQKQFLIRGYLDDQPIIRFDSLTRKMEPLVPWMEKAEKETFLGPEWVFRADLEKLSKLDHHAGGLHIWQVNLGCELREDGTKGGFLHYGYNGKDFISFDKEIPIWVITQSKAMKVKEEWEKDTGWSERNKIYLEKTCIEWLQRYLSYRKKTLQRTEPPVGKVTRKVVDDSLEVLICQAFGFYPKEIQATWTRDGENWEQETFRRTVAPNSDGTYYVWISIEIDPKERDRFRCHLEHDALQEPLVLALKDETATEWRIPVATVAGVISGAVIFFLMCRCWRRRMNQKAKSLVDEVLSSSLNCGIDDKIQSEPMLQSEVIWEDMESCGEQSPQRVLEDSGSTLHRREWKMKPHRRPESWTGKLRTLDKAEATESEEMEQEWPEADRSVRSFSETFRGSRGRLLLTSSNLRSPGCHHQGGPAIGTRAFPLHLHLGKRINRSSSKMTRMVPAGTSHSPAKRGERNMLLIRLEAALQGFFHKC